MYTRVSAPEDAKTHILGWSTFMDSSGAALCGKNPFPARWEETESGTVCLGCYGKYRTINEQSRRRRVA